MFFFFTPQKHFTNQSSAPMLGVGRDLTLFCSKPRPLFSWTRVWNGGVAWGCLGLYGLFHLSRPPSKGPNGTSCFFVLFSYSPVNPMLEMSDKSWPVHSLASIPMLNNLNPLTMECGVPTTHSETSPRVLDFLTFEVACSAMRLVRSNCGLRNRFRILLHRTLVTEITN